MKKLYPLCFFLVLFLALAAGLGVWLSGLALEGRPASRASTPAVSPPGLPTLAPRAVMPTRILTPESTGPATAATHRPLQLIITEINR